jgi:RHS repeat-associated protein
MSVKPRTHMMGILLLIVAAGAWTLQLAIAQFDRMPQIIHQSRFEANEISGVVPFVPPEPSTTWIPMDPTIVPSFKETIEFLYEAPNPVQRGMRGDPIQAHRAMVARGRVINEAGQPLSGVLVRFQGFPDWGYTYSRADGYYDLVGNGGADVTLDYSKAGFIRSQRRQFGAWKSFSLYEDVMLIGYVPNSQVITMGATIPQLGNGPVSTDADGSRRASVYFPSGITAQAEVAGSAPISLPQLTFRATEFTVGANGARRMPGTLPENIAYTYAVELSSDEAVSIGAESVRFSAPVSLYVDNFLDVKIGEAVPLAYYDYGQGHWVGENNGHVARVLSISGGLARLDLRGTGQEATPADYLDYGVSAEEQAMIAQRFSTGQSFWRAKITHFSPWDCNFPYIPPNDSVAPAPPEPSLDEEGPDDEDSPTNPCENPADCEPEENEEDDPTSCPDIEESGSIISCKDRTLRERLTLAGSSEALYYSSDRTPIHGTGILTPLRRPVEVQITPGQLPASLLGVRVIFESGGVTTIRRYIPAVSLSDTFEVRLGNLYSGTALQGFADYSVRTCYEYALEMASSGSGFVNGWAQFAGAQLSNNAGGFVFTRNEARTFERCSARMPGRVNFPHVRISQPPTFLVMDQRGQGLGGLSLESRHLFDPEKGMLYMGNGTRTRAEPLEGAYNNFGAVGAGVFEQMPTRDVTGFGNVDAEGCYLFWQSIDGQQMQLTKRCPGGSDTNLGTIQYCTDDPYKPGICPVDQIIDPPTNAYTLPNGTTYLYNLTGLFQITPGPPRPIYSLIADPLNDCLIAGVAKYENSLLVACNIPAKRVGTPYVAIVGRNNKLQKIAGGGSLPISTDPLKLQLDTIQQMRVSPDNVIYLITKSGFDPARALRIGAQIAPQYLEPKDKNNQFLREPLLIAPGLDGYHWLTRQVSSEQRLYAVNGRTHVGQLLLDPSAEPFVDGDFAPQLAFLNLLAQRTAWFDVADMHLGPDGSLFVTKASGMYRYGKSRTFYRSKPTAYRIPSADGSMVYIFDEQGRHLESRSKLTGAVVQRFEMNPTKQVTRVVDGDGDALRIERTPNNGPIRFIAQDGQVSELRLTTAGYASSLRFLATSQEWTMAYDRDGLVTRFTKPKGNFSSYVWSPFARLKTAADSEGGRWDIQGLHASYLSNTDQMSRLEGGATKYHSYLSGRGVLNVVTDKPGNVQDRSTQTQSLQRTNVHLPDVSTPLFRIRTETLDEPDPLFGFSAPVLAKRKYAEDNISITSRTTRTATPVSAAATLGEFSLRAKTRTTNDFGGSQFRESESFYDAITRTTTTINRGVRAQSQIDAQERVIKATVDGITPVNYSYDTRGRLTTVSTGSGIEERRTVLQYDSFGFVNRIVDPLDRVLLLTNDAIGRTTMMTLPDKRVVEFRYDPNDNLIGIKPPGRPWHTFEYTGQDQLKRYLPPVATNTGSNDTQYRYNKVPQPSVETRPGGETLTANYVNTLLDTLNVPDGAYRFEYSGRRPTKLDTPAQGGCALSLENHFSGYFLDRQSYRSCGVGLGEVIRERNGFLELDTIGVASRVNALPELSYRIGYRESAGAHTGQLAHLRYGTAAGSRQLNFVFDTAALSPLLRGTNAELLSDGYAYNAFGEHLGYVAQSNADPKNPIELFKQNFVRDKLGRITEKSEVVNGVTTVYGYEYDLAGRLEKVSENGVLMRTYGFDSNSNRISMLAGSSSITGTADDQDRLLSYGTNTYTYAANGETTSRTKAGSVRNFDYDVMGNLRTLTEGTLQLRYGFDAQGRRVQRYQNNVLTHTWLYQDQLRIAGEIKADGSLQQFVYGEKVNVPSLILRRENKVFVAYRVISDHLGSVRLVVKASDGIIMQRMRYDEYGQVLEDTNPGFQPFGYAGGLYDPDTGLVRFGARDYDPEIGRWLAKDPVRFDGGLNLYEYVESNPIMLTDPSGLWAWGDPLPQGVVNACAGLGDGVSLGLTTGIRELMGTNDVVDPSSPEYVGGLVAGVAITSRGYATGAELSIGRNFRLALWGNRTGHPTGRFPHYHRRGTDANGNTRPGQGIGRHRPWDKKSTDTCGCDRF